MALFTSFPSQINKSSNNDVTSQYFMARNTFFNLDRNIFTPIFSFFYRELPRIASRTDVTLQTILFNVWNKTLYFYPSNFYMSINTLEIYSLLQTRIYMSLRYELNKTGERRVFLLGTIFFLKLHIFNFSVNHKHTFFKKSPIKTIW